MNRQLFRVVRERAGDRCEYCLLPQSAFPLPFQIDHVIAQKHGGETSENNLALACTHCNRYKGPNIAGFDAESGTVVRLFHPRTDVWQQHFEMVGSRIRGKTAVGRVTVTMLALNCPDQLLIRQALLKENAISGSAELPDGFSFSLHGDQLSLAEFGEWIALERRRCPFLNFELSITGTDSLYWLTPHGSGRNESRPRAGVFSVNGGRELVPLSTTSAARGDPLPLAPPVLAGHLTPQVQTSVEQFYQAIERIFESWVNRSSSPHTRRAYRDDIFSFVHFLGIVWPQQAPRLLQVSVFEVQQFREALLEAGAANKTLNRRSARSPPSTNI